MKIKNLAIIILMTTFLIILGTKVYAATGTINEDATKLRKEPDSKTVLDLLNKGDEVEILEQEDDWYKVKAQTEQGKVTGYVSDKYIDAESNEQPEEPSEKEDTTNTTEANSTDVTTPIEIKEKDEYKLEQEISVKILPLINCKEKGKISGNVKVLEIINDWVKIENDTESGWIRKNTLKNSITQQESTPQEQQPEEPTTETNTDNQTTDMQTTKPEENQEPETTEINKVGYVSADGLRVRKEATTDSEEIDSLSKNDKVQIIGKQGNWYKIDMDGKVGYVSAKYISDTKLPEITSRSGSTLKKENIIKKEETKQEETTKTEEQNDEQQAEQKSEEFVENVPSTSETTGASETRGAEVVEYAKQYLGYKYVSGGASPKTGFDCSGFTQYVYKHFGITLNRSSAQQINDGFAVEKSNLKPGDIVLFNNTANTKIGHVGIYVGEGNFIHASNPSDGVKITTLTSGYYQKRYVGARRVF